MPRPIDWKHHHTLAELEAAYRQALDKHHQSRIWAIWQLKRGKSGTQVAEDLLVHPRTVYSWIRRYQQAGLEGLMPLPHQGRIEKRHFERDELQALVDQASVTRLEDVREALAERFGASYTLSGVWHLLRRYGIDWKPRP